MLRDPYWPLRAARELKYPVAWPVQYGRAADGRAPAREPVMRAEQRDFAKTGAK
jgi:hypothetical protein